MGGRRQRGRFLPGAREPGCELGLGCLDDPHWREWTIFVLEHASQASFLTGARAVGASREEESMDVLYERVAGLDVHTDTVVACVRIMADGTAKRECRTFSTTTEQ